MTGPLKIATYTYTVEPAAGNAQGELPLTTLVQHILETATFHAEAWKVGYSTLIRENHAWVLARLAVEMERYPRIGDTCAVSTWIESYNKYFSARNFAFADGSGHTFGYARSVWSMIDMHTRTSVDLTTFGHLAGRVSDQACPIAPQSKLKPVGGHPLITWPVRYSDIDLNRHVNSVKYIEHMLDSFPLQQYDDHAVKRFEINYISETRYGDHLTLFREETAPGVYALDIRTGESGTVCRGKICFEPRK